MNHEKKSGIRTAELYDIEAQNKTWLEGGLKFYLGVGTLHDMCDRARTLHSTVRSPNRGDYCELKDKRSAGSQQPGRSVHLLAADEPKTQTFNGVWSESPFLPEKEPLCDC